MRIVIQRVAEAAVSVGDRQVSAIGPGLMAAYYVGKPISSDLSAEREILEKASRAV